MTNGHVHSFRKVGGKLFCIYPTCSRKLTPLEVHGKLVSCPKCQSQFIFDLGNYGPETLQISCCKCDSKVPYHPTLETQTALLNDIAMGKLTQDIEEQRKSYRTRYEALVKKEAELQTQIDKYKEHQALLAYKETKLKEQIERVTQRFRERKAKLFAKLALERQKLIAVKVKQEEEIQPNPEAGEAVLRLLDKIYGDPS